MITFTLFRHKSVENNELASDDFTPFAHLGQVVAYANTDKEVFPDVDRFKEKIKEAFFP